MRVRGAALFTLDKEASETLLIRLNKSDARWSRKGPQAGGGK